MYKSIKESIDFKLSIFKKVGKTYWKLREELGVAVSDLEGDLEPFLERTDIK